jgi:hypothetical protein
MKQLSIGISLTIRKTIYKAGISFNRKYSTVVTFRMASRLCILMLLADMIVLINASHFRGGIITW